MIRSLHKFCSMLPAFAFEAWPVIPIEEAVRSELESWHGAIVSEIQLRAVS